MAAESLSLSELRSMINADLLDCSDVDRELFDRARIEPAKWQLSPWADDTGGFWAVAVHGGRVLWYNDFEEGFNVSRFDEPGRIPESEYWCNQDPLRLALPHLAGDGGQKLGAPVAIPDA